MTTATIEIRPRLRRAGFAVMAAGLMLASAGMAHAQGGAQQRPGSALAKPTTPEEIEAAKPNPQFPGLRLQLPPLDQMDPKMREEFVRQSQAFNTPVGPRVPLIFSPEINAAWGAMGAAIQKSELPQDLFELTILMTAKEWRANFEWWVHEPAAIRAGLPEAAVEAIRRGRRPKFANAGQEAAYRYLSELLGPRHRVSDATYERLRAIIGTRQVVELTVIAGHYTNVAMAIVAHGIPVRSNVKPPFPDR